MTALFQKLSSYASIWTLCLICLLAFSLMLWGALTDAAITDELAHIPAGYGYVRDLDYRLNPEHPPLVKAISALPLLFLNPNFPTEDSAWTNDVNGQWAMGAKFLYESGNDADQIIHWARIGPILLTILLIYLIYVWSRELLGGWWALLPAFLFALSPTVLAHGHYVTTDIGAAFGVVLSAYYFIKFLHHPARKNLIYAGLAFGVAQIAKFSAALIVPYFTVLIFIFYLAEALRNCEIQNAWGRFLHFLRTCVRAAKHLIIIFAIGYIFVVYPVYFLFTINYPIAKQAADTEFILGSFAGGPTATGATCEGVRCLADLNIWMAKNPVLKPFAEYMLGILMVLQRASGGNTNYFLGEVSASGSHWYFPITYLLKEPLPVLIAVFLALLYTLAGIVKKIRDQGLRARDYFLNYLGVSFTEFSMFVFIVIYWAWSIRSPLNIGFRHLLPTMPFIYILTTGVAKRWVVKFEFPKTNTIFDLIKAGSRTIFIAFLKYLFLILLLFWFAAGTLFAAPYFLSYFNEVGGGVNSGYRYVTDSNYDWGQDLVRLKNFIIAHPEIDKIAVDYFGGGSQKYYLGARGEGWWSARGNPTDVGIHWLAISVNTLQGAIQPLAVGQQRKPEDEYRWLTELRPQKPGTGNVPEPDFKAGTSIFIYKL
ncbi:MAG: glycosyltransferase family 39 protein [bacterium]|nr:glycosyltransferase family 39 protein [bacterium]